MIYILNYGTIELNCGEVFVAAYGNRQSALAHARTSLQEMIQDNVELKGKIVETEQNGKIKVVLVSGTGIECDWYTIEEVVLTK